MCGNPWFQRGVAIICSALQLDISDFGLLQVHTYRAKPPPAMPDILKCVLELMLAMSDSADVRQMHAKVGGCPQHLEPRTLL